MEITEIYGIQTIKDETFIQGINDKNEDIIIKFNTIELLEWIEIKELKNEMHKYINEL